MEQLAAAAAMAASRLAGFTLSTNLQRVHVAQAGDALRGPLLIQTPF